MSFIQITRKRGVKWTWLRKCFFLLFAGLALLIMCPLLLSMAKLLAYETVTDTMPLSPSAGGNLSLYIHSECIHSALNKNSSALQNGVILILVGGKTKMSMFLTKMLPLLEKNFLARYPYPVHLFHEGMSNEDKLRARRAIPGAEKVEFEDVSGIWQNLPKGVSERKLLQWMNTREQHRYQGRGYRIMCRFWAGLVWQLSSLDSYEYYWRLDTDSFLTKPVLCDVFQVMKANECVYGYRNIRDEPYPLVKGLWANFVDWAQNALTPAELQYMQRFALKDDVYKGIMYYNNFELGKMSLKRHTLYHSLFRALDEKEPLGIMRYRWGDAPIHTLGVEAVMQREQWKKCFFDPKFGGYLHGRGVF